MKNYDFDGEKYEKVSGLQKSWGNRIIDELQFDGNESVLDIGCGDGLLTRRIGDMLPKGRIIGLDSSPSMINNAKKYISPNCSFVLSDILDMDYKNEFDVIFSNACLHWVKNHKKLYENCNKALKKDGIIRFNFAKSDNCKHFIKVINEKITSEKHSEYFKDFEWPWYFPSIDEYNAILDKFDFSEKRVWEEKLDTYFKDRESLDNWIEEPGLVPFLSNISDEKDKQSFAHEVKEETAMLMKTNNNQYYELYIRMNVFIRK